MGPDSQGRHLPRKLCLITPVLIICLVFIIYPWSISCQKNETGDSTLEQKNGENGGESKSASNGHNNIRALNDNGSTTGDGGDYVTGEFLRKALINHTLTHGGEQDLDQLIFSALPQGSKLVLQSVKVVETDEHGNPTKHSKGKSPVHWDVKVTNATNEPDPDSETDEEEDDESDEEAPEPINYNHKNQGILSGVVGGESVVVPVVKSAQGDLASSGSHSQANYKTYGAQEREKQKVLKQHHGNDHGKTNKITHTDTDGKTVTNYVGKEDGIKDYKKNKGKSESSEQERYRDTKKKNKGRRVSGFKRVYHKEEFQRTEHFYDDEDAKRIAESYGLKKKEEDGKHGLKDDDRKYHGKKTAYTDGKEIKDEKGTSHGFNKGQHTAYKDSEKHYLNSKYAKSNGQTHGSPPNYNQNDNNYNQHSPEHHEEQSPPQQYHHPSHNYHGSYSQPPKTTIRQPPATPNNYNSYYMNFKPGYLQSHFSPSSNPLDNANTIAVMSKVPLAASFIVTQPQHEDDDKEDSFSASSTDEPSFYEGEDMEKMPKSRKSKKEPDEIKMYYSPRNRHVKELTHPETFTPSQSTTWRNYPRTTFTSKIGNDGNTNMDGRTGGRNQSSERDGRHQFIKSNPLLDPKYGGYSTLVKFNPTTYISLGDEDGLTGSAKDGAGEAHPPEEAEDAGTDSDSHSDPENIRENPGTSTASEDASDPYGQGQGQGQGQGYRQPTQHRRPRPHAPSRWISLSLGDPELVKEIQANPFNRQQNHNPINMRRPPPRIHKIIRPGGGGSSGYPPPRFSPPIRPRPRPDAFPHRNPVLDQSQGHEYDSSKYPPNVVSAPKRSKGGGGHKHKNNGVPDGEITTDEGGGEDNRYNLVSESDHPPKNPGILSNPSSSQGFRPLNNNNNNRNPKNTNRPHRIISHAIPPFMNSLMDSVANFFGNVG